MDRSSRRLLAGFLAALAAACSSLLSPTELHELAAAESRWARRPFQDYRFEVVRSCFCDPLATQWARVEVRNGAVSRVVIVESGADVPADRYSWFPTIESVFGSIRSAARDEWVADIRIEFDPVLGFPRRFATYAKPEIADGSGSTEIRNVGPTPP